MHLFVFSLRSLVLANLSVSLFMTGVIWFVQVVHYPLFAKVGAEQFPDYEKQHANRTTYVVAAPMLVELGASAILAVRAWRGPAATPSVIALALVIVVWLSTFLLQVPGHNRLAGGYDTAVQRRLVQTNWLRTIAWTARSVVLLYALIQL